MHTYRQSEKFSPRRHNQQCHPFSLLSGLWSKPRQLGMKQKHSSVWFQPSWESYQKIVSADRNKDREEQQAHQHHKFLALGTCTEGSWSRAVTSISKWTALPIHFLCSCRGIALRWMFDHFHSQMWLDTSWRNKAPSSPWDARNTFLNPGKNSEAVALNHGIKSLSVLDHGQELISDVRTSSELCLNILKVYSFTPKEKFWLSLHNVINVWLSHYLGWKSLHPLLGTKAMGKISKI